MNWNTHRTIYNHIRGCLMAVAETAKSSSKASGGARPRKQSKAKTATRRKARSTLCSGGVWLQANQGAGYSLPCLQSQFNSALTRNHYEGYAPSQWGSGDDSLRFASLHFVPCTRPPLFGASQIVTGSNQHVALGGGNYLNQSSQIDNGSTVGAGGNITMVASNRIVGVAANITGGRNVTLFGVNGVDLLAGQNTSYVDTNITSGSKSLVSSQTNTQSTSASSTALGTSVTGGNVSITSSMGNITLQAANITATNALTLSAVNGTIAFTSANQSSFNSVASTGSSTLTQSASGNGQSSTNASFTLLHYGNLSVAAQSITIDVSSNQSITSLASQPGMGWITDLQNDPALAGKINWNAINEAHKNWNYSQQGLSPAGAALLSIALAYATGGMGADLVGGTVTSVTATGATVVTTTAFGAVANAAFTTLATQASLAFANNGGDLGKALESLGSSANVRGLLTSMLTAGAIQALPSILPSSMISMLDATVQSTFGTQLTQQLITNAATAVVSSAINGTSLSNNLQQGIVNALLTTVAAQGANAIGSASSPTVNADGTVNPAVLNTFGQMFSHAVLGCAVGAAKTSTASGQGGCSAGALGAVVGEITAQTLDPYSTGYIGSGTTPSFAGLMSGLAVAVNGGSVTQINIGAAAGSNAAQNNNAFAARLLKQLCTKTPVCATLLFSTAATKFIADEVSRIKGKYPCISDSVAEDSAIAAYLGYLAAPYVAAGTNAIVNWINSLGAGASGTATNMTVAAPPGNTTIVTPRPPPANISDNVLITPIANVTIPVGTITPADPPSGNTTLGGHCQTGCDPVTFGDTVVTAVPVGDRTAIENTLGNVMGGLPVNPSGGNGSAINNTNPITVYPNGTQTDAERVFDSLPLTNINGISSSRGNWGRTGTLPDGTTVNVRPSADGRPTIQIIDRNGSGRSVGEIRFGSSN